MLELPVPSRATAATFLCGHHRGGRITRLGLDVRRQRWRLRWCDRQGIGRAVGRRIRLGDRGQGMHGLSRRFLLWPRAGGYAAFPRP